MLAGGADESVPTPLQEQAVVGVVVSRTRDVLEPLKLFFPAYSSPWRPGFREAIVGDISPWIWLLLSLFLATVQTSYCNSFLFLAMVGDTLKIVSR